MKIISFSLWGSNPAYLDGAVANLRLARIYYPGWRPMVFCADEISLDWRSALFQAGAYVVHRAGRPHTGLFWRFEPAFQPGVEAFISRDCDSRLNPREAAAVAEWLASGKRLHTMRDHYEHIVPILGGMWGCLHWPEFKGLLESWSRTGRMGDDQDFLKTKIWPLVKDGGAVAHDRYISDTTVDTPGGPFTYKPAEFFGGDDLRPFPAHAALDDKIHGAHVGARVSHD